jgi:hypothetical protein
MRVDYYPVLPTEGLGIKSPGTSPIYPGCPLLSPICGDYYLPQTVSPHIHRLYYDYYS